MEARTCDSRASLLLADRALTRLSLKVALEADPRLTVIAEAGTDEEAVREAERTQPNIVLIGADLEGDLHLAIQQIFQSVPQSAVIVLANTDDAEGLVPAVRAGAIGYVPGTTTPDGLHRVIRAVLEDQAAVPRSMVRTLILELRASPRSDAKSGETD